MRRILLFALGSTGLLALNSRLEHLHHPMPAWLLLGLFLLLCAATGMGPFGDADESEASSPLGHALRLFFFGGLGLGSLVLGGIGWSERHSGQWTALLALKMPLGLLSLALCLYFLLRGRR